MNLLFAALVLIGWPAAGLAQSVRVAVPEENLRKEPRVTGNNRLATVFEGTVLEGVGRRGRWLEVTLEGWIWNESIAAADRDGFDLVVSRAGGENLREAPSGQARRAAILLRGMLLEDLERQESWTRVRRTAWMWSESLSPLAPVAADSEGAAAPEETVTTTVVGAAEPEERVERLVVPDSSVRLHVSPDGDTLASLLPGADLQIMARQGDWARVRLDGWVWLPGALPAESVAVSEDISPQDVQASPQRFVGRTVRWTVQYVSLERAEPIRTDFYEGEPFILARVPDRHEGFVYIAVPPELVGTVEQIRPLRTLEILARVRTGRSALMGVPVLDLIAIY